MDDLVAPADVPLQGHPVAVAVVAVPAQAQLVAPPRPPERLEVAASRAVRQVEALEVDRRSGLACGVEGQLCVGQDLEASDFDAERVGNVGIAVGLRVGQAREQRRGSHESEDKRVTDDSHSGSLLDSALIPIIALLAPPQ